MDDRRRLIQEANRQNANWFLGIVGMGLGAVAGLVFGAYVLVPSMDATGFWLTLVAIVVGAIAGQQIASRLTYR